MELNEIKEGVMVVRSKGDYVVGRVGEIIDFNLVKERVRVQWIGHNATWVSIKSVELKSKPYMIQPFDEAKRNPVTLKHPSPKYIAL